MNYEPIIGLEVHVELQTKSKMFCGCLNEPFGSDPNSLTCPTCLGLPGALPVPNREAIKSCLMIGLALGCGVNSRSYFERKNYFYPDLPKGYQISQYQKPFCFGGLIIISDRPIRINRVHLEEDTGKLTHFGRGEAGYSLVNFNRSGVPLVEIVTEPDFNSVENVVEYLQELQRIIRYLGISGADMEKGSMRLEPTVNLRITEAGEIFYTPLAEIKNINSFRFVRKALEYEISRQFKEFTVTRIEKGAGNKITVGFNESQGETYRQREKEEANDYRYFPEPDVPPFDLSAAWLEEIKNNLPELPKGKRERLVKQYGISVYQAGVLGELLERASYFEDLVKAGFTGVRAANLLINHPEILGRNPEAVFREFKKKAEETISDEATLQGIVDEVLAENSGTANQWQQGKKEVLGFLIGQAMKKTQGKSDPRRLAALFEKNLLKP